MKSLHCSIIIVIINFIISLVFVNGAHGSLFPVKECDKNSLLNSGFKCYNGGECLIVQLNATNSMRICSCRAGFTGRQCEQKSMHVQKQSAPCNANVDPCEPNGYCNASPNAATDGSVGFYCRCKPGFSGPLCQENVNDCLNATCFNGGLCIDGINSYECECKWPYIGRYCQTRMRCNDGEQVCKNEAFCVEDGHGLPNCICRTGYEGIDCSIKKDFSIITSSTTTTSTKTTTTTTTKTSTTTSFSSSSTIVSTSTANALSSNNQTNNGSYVLVVNISPQEFKQKQQEIIREFEKRFNMLMFIKNDLILPYYKNNSTNTLWTKVYFKPIFACVFNSDEHTNSQNCLDSENFDQVLSVFNQKSSLLPQYVSNISYESYSEAIKTPIINDITNSRSGPKIESTLTTILCICLSISLLLGISLALTVLLRQQNLKKVKAPVWFPPSLDEKPSKNSNLIYEMNQFSQQQQQHQQTGWFNTKKFEAFFSNKKHEHTPNNHLYSPNSASENDYSDILPPQNKHRRVETPNSAATNYSSNSTLLLKTPEYCPSTPESLPENQYQQQQHNVLLQPINYKGANYGQTPLMLYILGKSKTNQKIMPTDIEMLDTFLHNSLMQINAQNNDGETALHLSARCGLYEIFDKLLKHAKIDLTLCDQYGRNVLHTAVCSSQYKIVKLILNHCSQLCHTNEQNVMLNTANFLLDERFDLIDSKTQDEMGETGLIIASRLNLNTIMQLFIDFNANVNATDNEGRSALHWCAKVNNVQGALLLVQSGANVNMQDNDEKTPLNAALGELCTKDVVNLLIKYDAFVSGEDELKYNKMRTIMDRLNNTQSENALQKLKQAAKNQKPTNAASANVGVASASTKRKYSETVESNSSNKCSKSVKKASSPGRPESRSEPSANTQTSYQYFNSNANSYLNYNHQQYAYSTGYNAATVYQNDSGYYASNQNLSINYNANNQNSSNAYYFTNPSFTPSGHTTDAYAAYF